MANSVGDLDDWEFLSDEDSSPKLRELASDSDGDAIKIDYFDLDYPSRTVSKGNLQRFTVEDALVDSKMDSESDSRVFLPEESVDPENEDVVGIVDKIESDEVKALSDDSEVILSGGLPEESVHIENEEVVGIVDKNESDEVKAPSDDSEVILSGGLFEEQAEECGGSVVGDNFDGVAEEGEKVMVSCCEADSEESAMGDEKSSNALGDDVSSVEKSRVAWWKMPMEFLKFCAFRMKPLWSLSVVAAVLGAFVLTKKLYRMKQRARTLPLKISFEKKTSQLKIQAARLNEAFTMVRHVPVIRATMLANNGSSPWPLVGFQ